MARRKKAEETSARVRNLLALDAAGIMRRLAARREEMFILFSRLRSRGPLVETVASHYAEGAFVQLIHLSEQEQAVVDHFYARLDELRWYFTYTEDMPGTAHQTFIALHRRLEESYRLFVETIGLPVQPDGVRVVNAEAVRHEEAPVEATPVALVPLPRRRRAPPA
ncbi:hypothetical protein [Corallococcus llansteffanensis]|uniref:Uncharacterized protein n=1 Tax=Corallococcus llansteffanensis TaxID=2316731 RepID=A0A3A8QKA1_9BACT|nr:hypothetical protein [Corallococcus llansteffanensis]RKH68191.1 hypothetical protein D7V93_01695 [Corallococcus llansteffanensis]